jgi:ferredoxin
MPSIKFPGMGGPLQLSEPLSVLEAALQCGFELNHVCGGKARCATCEVKIVSGEVSRPLNVEYELLYDRVDNYKQRLGCQTRILGDVEVALPVYSTSIDAIFDALPEVFISPQRLRSHKRHMELEYERDIKSPFYLFHKRYATTQEMQALRQERHRFAQNRQHGQFLERMDSYADARGNRRERPRYRRYRDHDRPGFDRPMGQNRAPASPAPGPANEGPAQGAKL